MATEQPSIAPQSPRHRQGVAMFAVLGAIVVVSLLGLVGLTMATKDQSLSGDLADIKSRDQVALAGLQLAINKLEANPANMIVQLNAFISDGRPSTAASSMRSWLDLSGTTVTAKAAEPDWLPLGTTSGDQSAVKVQILGIAQGDTSKVATVDSGAVYVALQCQARGRHGDLRTIQGTYRIHGVSLVFSQTTRSIVIPSYALYMGGTFNASNLSAQVTGDVYVNGSGGTFLNSTASMTIHGTFKWNGDFSTNAPLEVDSNVFIKGALYTNSGAPLTFKADLGIGDGFKTMNSSLTVGGNLWVGGTGNTDPWSSGANITVDSNFVFGPSGEKPVGGSIRVGQSAWFLSGIQKTNWTSPSDSISVQKSLYMTNASTVPFTFYLTANELGYTFHIGKNFVSTVASQTYAFGNSLSNLVPLWVGDSLYIAGTVSYAQVHAGSQAVAGDTSNVKTNGGVSFQKTGSVSHANYVTAPTAAQLGLDTAFQNTSVASNPMDSVKVDQIHSPLVNAHIVDLDAALMSKAEINATISPTNMNKLYKYMVNKGLTYNGYMILRLGPNDGFTRLFQDEATGFAGKALYIINSSFTINGATVGGGWPHSADSTNIQIIDIPAGNGNELNSWGWTYGDFSGIFYWESPPCGGGYKLALPTSTATVTHTFYGSIIIGSGNCSGSPASFTIDGNITLKNLASVYVDIGTNLTGVITSGTTTSGTTTSSTTTTTAYTASPLLRQVTDKPFFEAKGIYR